MRVVCGFLIGGTLVGTLLAIWLWRTGTPPSVADTSAAGEVLIDDLRSAQKTPKATPYVAGESKTYAKKWGGDPTPQELISHFRSHDLKVRSESIRALGKIGEPAVEPLIDALGDPNEEVRICSSDALIRCGEAALPKLFATLKDHKRGFWALRTLHKVSPLEFERVQRKIVAKDPDYLHLTPYLDSLQLKEAAVEKMLEN